VETANLRLGGKVGREANLMRYLGDPDLSGPAVLAVLREHGRMHFKVLCSHLRVRGLTSQGNLIQTLGILCRQGLLIADTEYFNGWDSDATVELSPSVRELAQVLGLSLKELVGRDPLKSAMFSPFYGRPTELQGAEAADLFVLMPFREDLRAVYDDHISQVARKLNCTVKRGDDFFTTHDIMKDVWNGICSAKVILADCTDRNPNVFYEIGMAHTVGKPVVLITQNTDDVPFDLRHIRYIRYQYTPPGMRKFEELLSRTLEEILA